MPGERRPRLWCHGCGRVAGGVQLRPVSGHRDVRCWRVGVLLGAVSGCGALVAMEGWLVSVRLVDACAGGACWGRMF